MGDLTGKSLANGDLPGSNLANGDSLGKSLANCDLPRKKSGKVMSCELCQATVWQMDDLPEKRPSELNPGQCAF